MTHYSDRSLTTACGLPSAEVPTTYGAGCLVDCPACRRALGLVRLDKRDRGLASRTGAE